LQRGAIFAARKWEATMADRAALGAIGWILGAVTAAVIAITGLVVSANLLSVEAAPYEMSSH
jgi:hypothetical protein